MSGNPRPPTTLRATARRETRVLGSRFLADAHAVADEAAARDRRRALAAEFPGATHHCWALRLRAVTGPRELSDDAGEPAGTAGMPILQALRRAGVLDAQVVVARWFGGTRLGKGGLARAYRDAARTAIEAAGTRDLVPRTRLRLSGPAAADGEVRHAVARHGGRVDTAGYDGAGRADLVVDLPEEGVEALRDDLGRVTRGAWRIDGAGGPPRPAPSGGAGGGG